VRRTIKPATTRTHTITNEESIDSLEIKFFLTEDYKASPPPYNLTHGNVSNLASSQT